MTKENAKDYATVPRDGYMVPLIGVPKDATEGNCEGCGATLHITKLVFDGSKMLCEDCRKELE